MVSNVAAHAVFSEWIYQAYGHARWRWSVLSVVAEWWQEIGWDSGGRVLQSKRTRVGLLRIWQNKNPHQGDRWLSEVSECLEWSALYYRSAKNAGFARPFVVTFLDENYPVSLREIDEPPPVLWASQPWETVADWFSESQRRLAVIGSRRWSAYGQQATKVFVDSLVAEHTCIIISGCAYGIDSLAHQRALVQGGKTVGVLGCGLEQVNSRTRKLFANENALLVSEFPPEMPAAKWTFPQRNRLISALSLGVLIIEAQQRSGTLITASTALAQGRELFVVTQPFTSMNAAGVIRLVHQGAHLVAQPNDVAGILFPQVSQNGQKLLLPQFSGLAEVEQQILDILWKHDGRLSEGTCRQLVSPSGSEAWVSALLNLELRGIIHASLGVLQLQ